MKFSLKNRFNNFSLYILKRKALEFDSGLCSLSQPVRVFVHLSLRARTWRFNLLAELTLKLSLSNAIRSSGLLLQRTSQTKKDNQAAWPHINLFVPLPSSYCSYISALRFFSSLPIPKSVFLLLKRSFDFYCNVLWEKYSRFEELKLQKHRPLNVIDDFSVKILTS